MAEVDNMTIQSLKRLEFVRSYTTSYLTTAANVAEKLYSTGRSFTPTLVEPYVASVEEKVVSYSAPVITTVQDVSQKLLKDVDDKVDLVLTSSNQYVQGSRAKVMDTVKFAHDKNLKYYEQARDVYLKLVDQAMDSVVKQQEGLSKSVVQAATSLQDSVRKASESGALGTASVLEGLLARFEKLADIPAVASILVKAHPVLEVAKKNYATAHAAVVASPLYKRVYDTSFSVLDKASSTSLYKSVVYPVIAPVAEPALDVLSKSQYYASVTDHLKPAAA